MLSRELQQDIAKRYGGGLLHGMVKKSFDRRLVEGLKLEVKRDTRAYAAIVFIDVSGFSQKVQEMQPEEIRSFLDSYYKETIPAIYSNGGHIDRIAGDGILAVFSPFLTPGTTSNGMNAAALAVSEVLVGKLAETDYESKVAIASGELVFCKTGLADLYEDFTIVGNPLTMAYRLEAIAAANEILCPADSPITALTRAQAVRQPAREGHKRWHITREEHDLPGIGETAVTVQTLIAVG